MAVKSPAGNPLPDPVLEKKVQGLVEALFKRGAKDSARRLQVVVQSYQHFTVEGASQYLRKEEIVDELENQPFWPLSVLRFFRNVLSIAPIILTWFALGLAATGYQNDLADTRYAPVDRYEPFLRLWQDSFHGNHGFVIPFSQAAGWDAFLLSVLVGLIIIVPVGEWWYRKHLYSSLTECDAVLDELLALISRDGANSHLAETDINKITKGIEGALQKVMLNYKQVAVETGEMVKDTHQKTQDILKDTHQKTQDILRKFNTDLGVFNSDVTALTGGLTKLDNNLDNYGQKLTELTDASGRLANSSNDLAQNAKNMAESATESARASQGISVQLNDLNTTQKNIVDTQQKVADTIAQSQQQVAQTIAQTQGDVVQRFAATQQDIVKEIKDTQGDVVQRFTATQQSIVQEIKDTQNQVVKDITGVADKMEASTRDTRDVARGLEDVAAGLKQLTQADFQVMTDQVGAAAKQVSAVANSLGQVDQHLVGTTHELYSAASALNQATRRWWHFGRRRTPSPTQTQQNPFQTQQPHP